MKAKSHPPTRPRRPSIAGGAGTQAALFVAAGAVVGVIIGGAIAFLRSDLAAGAGQLRARVPAAPEQAEPWREGRITWGSQTVAIESRVKTGV
jgi:hypothetical protein